MSDRERAKVAVWAICTTAGVALLVYVTVGLWASSILGLLAAWFLLLGILTWRVIYRHGKMGPMSNAPTSSPAPLATEADRALSIADNAVQTVVDTIVVGLRRRGKRVTEVDVLTEPRNPQMEETDMAIIGALVDGRSISITINVTP